MKRKTISLILVFLMVSMTTVPFKGDHVVKSGGYTIDGNRVYINDSHVDMGVTPATVIGSGFVVFDFLLKHQIFYPVDDTIDFVWGFNTEITKPTSSALWKNCSHVRTRTVEKWGSITLKNVISYQNLGIGNYGNYEVKYGNRNNYYLYKVNQSIENGTSIICAFSQMSNPSSGTYVLSGNYNATEKYEAWFPDWKESALQFQKVKYNYGGMNTWYILEDVNIVIVPNVRYKLRAYLEQKMNTQGKYWFAAKPHSETIAEAIAAGHFYAIDPWWDSGWNKRIPITIDSTYIKGNIRNFVALVELNDTVAGYCDGGKSIRFRSYNDSNEYYYDIDQFTGVNTSAKTLIWVNITDQLTTGEDFTFYMYFNNSAASKGERRDLCWKDYTLVFHMNEASGNLLSRCINPESGTAEVATPSGTEAAYRETGVVGFAINTSSAAKYTLAATTGHYEKYKGAGQYTFFQQLQLDTAVPNGGMFELNDDTNVNWWYDKTSYNDYVLYQTRAGFGGTGYFVKYKSAELHVFKSVDGRYRFESAITNANLSIFKNGVAIQNLVADCTGGFEDWAGTNDINFEAVANAVWSGKKDEFRLAYKGFSEAYINMTHNNMYRYSSFISLGATENKVVLPTMALIQPINASTGNNKRPVCKIWANDTDGNALTVNFYENSTGTWIRRQTNASVAANSTVCWNYTQASQFNTTFWWKATVNNSLANISETYHFKIKELSAPPTMDLVQPLNASTGNNKQPKCRIWANNTAGESQTINFYENSTGTWVRRQTNASVAANSTVQWNYTQATQFNATYWWNVTIVDGGVNISETFHFKVKELQAPPTTYLIYPKNETVGHNKQPVCKIWANNTAGESQTINFYENSTGAWIRRQTNASVPANTTVYWNFTQADQFITKYHWKVTIVDGGVNISNSYLFTTKLGPHYPTIYVVTPKNHSIGVNHQPTCIVWANDSQGCTLTVNFYNSSDGITYYHTQLNESVTSNSTVQWNYSQADVNDTVYWWKVTVDDGTTNATQFFNFTSKSSLVPKIFITAASPNGTTVPVNQVVLSITVALYNLTNCNITVFINSSGTWVEVGNLKNTAEGTYKFYVTGFVINHTYNWRANVSWGATKATGNYSFNTTELAGMEHMTQTFGVIAAVIGVVCLILFMVYRRRGRDGEDEGDEEYER